MAENPTHTNLYIRHLPLDWTKEQMQAIFAPYGHILSAKLLMDANNPAMSRGMGFVRFVNHEDAKNAASGMDGYIPEGSHKALSVKFAKDQQQGRSSAEESLATTSDTHAAAQAPSASGLAGDDKNLYVRDMPLTFTKEEFHKMYAPFGELVSSTVLADSTTGISRGLGFARYNTHEAALAALKATDGMMLPGAIKPIIVQFARDTSRKNAQAQAPPPQPPPTVPTMYFDPNTGMPYLVPMPLYPAPMPVMAPPPQPAAAASPFANIPAPLPVTATGITTLPTPPAGVTGPAVAPPAMPVPVPADPYAAYYAHAAAAYGGYGGPPVALPPHPAAAPPMGPPGSLPPQFPPFNPYGPPGFPVPYGLPPPGYGYPPGPPNSSSSRGGSSVRYAPYGPPPSRGRGGGGGGGGGGGHGHSSHNGTSE